MRKLRSDDEVIVITGKVKGKRGTIARLIGDEKVIVAGVNMVKRHTKPNLNLGKPGGIIEQEAAISVSNIAIFNPGTSKADRIGIQEGEDGTKKRVFKSNQQEID